MKISEGGVYIAPYMDEKTARALGIIYSDGHVIRTALRLTGSLRNLQFYREVVMPTMEDAFNMFQEDVYEYPHTSTFTGKQYKFLRLVYGSKALSTYLVNYLGFRRSEEERRNKGLSDKMKMKEFKKYVPDFIKFYLASASGISLSDKSKSIVINIPDVSRSMLEDIGGFLEDAVERPSLWLHHHLTADTYVLSISTVPALELFFGGFLNENPRIKKGIESYLEDYGIGRRAFKHLYQLYGDRIVQYRRI